MNQQPLYRKPFFIYAVLSASALLLLIWIIYTFFIFHVTNVDPKGSFFPTSQKTLTVTYNMKLNEVKKENISVSPERNYVIKTDGKKVMLFFETPFIKDEQVTIKLDNVSADTGSELSSEFKFTAKYLTSSQLSREEQARQLAESNSFENDYPLAQKLPYITDRFQVEGNFPDADSNKMPITVTSLSINTADPLAAPDTPSNLELLRQDRRAAIAWLNENGFNTEKYILYFTEPYIVEEFGGMYDHEPEIVDEDLD